MRAASHDYRDQFILTDPAGRRVPERDIVPVSDDAGEVGAVGPCVETWVVGDREQTSSGVLGKIVIEIAPPTNPADCHRQPGPGRIGPPVSPGP